MFKIRREHMEAFRPVVRAQLPSRILADLQKQGVRAEREPATGSVVATDPRGFQTRLSFYPDGLPARLTQPSGATSTFEHDGEGRLAALTYPGGERVELKRDARGNVVEQSRPGLPSYRYEYNEDRLSAVEHPDGTTTRFAYSPEGALEGLTDRTAATTLYRRDSNGKLQAIVDPLCRETSYVNDEEGRLEAVVLPDGSRQEYAFDPEKRVASILLRGGEVVSRQLDDQGRITAIVWADGARTDFEFDPAGHIVAARNEAGEITYTNTSTGDPLTETTPSGEVFYDYDPEGRLVGLTTPHGESVEYEYDSEGRVCLVRDWEGRENRISYALAGTIVDIRYGNGLVEQHQYSRIGRIQHAVVLDRNKRKISEQIYDYDSSQRLTNATDIWGDSPKERFALRLEHDAEGRLLAETDADSRRTFARHEYDAKGNLTSDNGRAVKVDLFDAPIKIGDATIEYEPRGNARLLPSPRGPITCTFASDRNLSEVKVGPTILQFRYDALGRRISKSDGTARWDYLWADNQLISEEFRQSEGAEVIRRDYLYFPGVLSPFAFRENGSTYWLQCDARGAIIRAFSENGSVAWRALYESFGRATVATGELRQPWRLPGQYEDEETGLHYNFARYYCPWLKTYLSQDPNAWQVGATNYSYAANDPWNKIDPTGSAPAVLQGSVQTSAPKSEPGFWAKLGEIAVDVIVVAASFAIAVAAVPIVAAVGLTGLAAAAAVTAITVVGGATLVFGGELAKQALRGDLLCIRCALNEALSSAVIDLITLEIAKIVPAKLKTAAARLLAKAGAAAEKLFAKKLATLLEKIRVKAPKVPLPAELRTPKPNSIYKINGYIYKTDELGRVSKVSGSLRIEKGKRLAGQQALVGKSGKAGDEGGHLIGSRFGGHGDKINLLPQNSNLNRSAWKKMENQWGKELKDGRTVDIEINPIYNEGSTRPDAFHVRQKIDGKNVDKFFENKPGG